MTFRFLLKMLKESSVIDRSVISVYHYPINTVGEYSNMSDQFSRTELLLGKEAMERLSKCRVAVFGIGGVG